MRIHRFQKDVPLDPAERKRMIDWLQVHRVWTVPIVDDGTELLATDENDMLIDSDVVTRPEDVGKVIYRNLHHALIHITWMYVNPLTDIQEDDESLNTAFRACIEAGPMYDRSLVMEEEPEGGWNDYNKWGVSRDVDLDCWAADLETALCDLATLVDVFYGEDGQDRHDRPEQCQATFRDDVVEIENYVSGCTDAGDGFCVRCGFAVIPTP